MTESVIKQIRDNPRLIFLFRLLLAVLFILAAISKFIDPAAFAGSIKDYQLLPAGLVGPVALALPWVELIAGLAILIPPTGRIAGLLLLFLLVVFDIAIASALIRGLEIRCGCFLQGSGKFVDALSLILDILLTLMAGLVIWASVVKSLREAE